MISCKKTEKKKTRLPQLRNTRNTLQRRLCKCVQARHQIQQQGKNTYTPHIIVHKLFLQKGRTDAFERKKDKKYVIKVFFIHTGLDYFHTEGEVGRKEVGIYRQWWHVHRTKYNRPYRFFNISQVMPHLLFAKIGALLGGGCGSHINVWNGMCVRYVCKSIQNVQPSVNHIMLSFWSVKHQHSANPVSVTPLLALLLSL